MRRSLLQTGAGHGFAGDARVGRAHFDPGRQIGDLFVGQLFAFGRHLQIGVGVTHGLDEQAFVRIARNDGGAVVAALEQAVAVFQGETALEFCGLGAVAFVTIVDKDGPDFILEKLAGRRDEGVCARAVEAQRESAARSQN